MIVSTRSVRYYYVQLSMYCTSYSMSELCGSRSHMKKKARKDTKEDTVQQSGTAGPLQFTLYLRSTEVT